MGDMADYYIELGLAQGWSPVGPRRPNAHSITCSKCGAEHLKWRATERGWRLFEDKRGAHNEKIEHQCGAATATDFEDLTDGN